MSGPSWQRSIDELAAATARLLAEGSHPSAIAGPYALRGRDAVVMQTRNLIVGVLNAEGRASDPSRVGDNPVRQLHHELTRLERVGDWIDDRNGARGRRAEPGHDPVDLSPAWKQARAAAVQTEIFVPALGQVPGPTAWAVLRDLNDVAGAIPYLDADLAAATARSGAAQHGTHPLRDPHRHATLASATEDLSRWLHQRTRDASTAARATATPAFALASTPAHLRFGADPAALPDSTRRLAAVLMHQDSEVSIVDIRAVLRALADGIDHTVYVLDRGHHEAAEVTRATHLLREAKAPITDLARLTAAARTLTPMRMDVQLMARETVAQLLAAAGQAAGADRPGAQRRPIPELGACVLRWAAETPLVTDAIDRSLHAAVRAHRVAVRRTGEVQWVIASSDPDSHAHTLLQATTNARRVLAGAHPGLIAAANHLSHPSANAVLDAARRAGAGREQLAEALATRRASGNLADRAPLAGHPMLALGPPPQPRASPATRGQHH